MTQPNICKKCQGHCCKTESVIVIRPQFDAIKNYLMPGAPSEIWGSIAVELNPTGTKCLALGENGCRIPRRERPGQCLSFPWIVNVEAMGFQRSSNCPHLDKFGKEPDCEQWSGLAMTAMVTAKMATTAAIFLREKLQGKHP